MPDCIHYEDLCSASVDGTLTREEKKELEAHLKTCPACREYLEDMREMRTLWRELDHPLPDGLHASIMAAVGADRAEHTPVDAPQPEEPAEKIRNIIPPHVRKRTVPVIGMLVAAAACVTLVLTGGMAGVISNSDPVVTETASAAAASGPAAAPRSAQAVEDEAEMMPFSDLAPGAADASGQDAAETENAPQAAAFTAPKAATAQAQEPFAGVQAAAAAANVEPVVELPEALSEHEFAAAYLAVGSSELPSIEGAVLLLEEDGRSYYSLPDDISVLEDVIDALSATGYSVSVINVAGVGTEADEPVKNTTGEILFIVVTKQ